MMDAMHLYSDHSKKEIPITHSIIVVVNIRIVWNVDKLAWDNLNTHFNV